MPTVSLSPIFNGWQGFTPAGLPLTLGQIYTYQAGTNTPALTYTTSAGNVANSTPIALDAGGRPPQEIWLDDSLAYKFVLQDSLGNTLGTYDNITGSGAQIAAVMAALNAYIADLANKVSNVKGPSLVGLNAALNYATGTIGAHFTYGPKSPKDYPWLAKGDGTTDDTAAIQACIDFCKTAQYTVDLSTPGVAYKVTSSLTLYNGSMIDGYSRGQFVEAFNQVPIAGKILFSPAAADNLFEFALTGSGVGDPFIEHVSIQGLYILGNANARYAFNLSTVIYSTFRDIGVSGFDAGFKIDASIQNRYENIIIKSSRVASVLYVSTTNVPTTDTWEQCSFFGAPQGPTLQGAIGIRFNNCLFEQLDNYGMDIARDCQNILVNGAYCEDVPYTNNANGSMFRVGYTAGGGLVVANHLIVTGGTYQGRNAGTVGMFLDCDYSNGVMVSGVNHSRFTNIIRTTANTRLDSVVWAGSNGTGWTTFANDMTKVSGSYPNGVINSGSNAQNLRLPVANINQITAADGNGSSINLAGAAIQFTPGSAAYVAPSTDNAVTCGRAAARWSVVYAGTGAINTSDEREKEQLTAASAAEKRVALAIKGSLRKFKFTDAVAERGQSARWHFGAGAQTVAAAFVAEGLDPAAYGLFCFDEWPADDDTPAGNRYGLRYDELAMFILAAI